MTAVTADKSRTIVLVDNNVYENKILINDFLTTNHFSKLTRDPPENTNTNSYGLYNNEIRFLENIK
jgi:hypothetical protein